MSLIFSFGSYTLLKFHLKILIVYTVLHFLFCWITYNFFSPSALKLRPHPIFIFFLIWLLKPGGLWKLSCRTESSSWKWLDFFLFCCRESQLHWTYTVCTMHYISKTIILSLMILMWKDCLVGKFCLWYSCRIRYHVKWAGKRKLYSWKTFFFLLWHFYSRWSRNWNIKA